MTLLGEGLKKKVEKFNDVLQLFGRERISGEYEVFSNTIKKCNEDSELLQFMDAFGEFEDCNLILEKVSSELHVVQSVEPIDVSSPREDVKKSNDFLKDDHVKIENLPESKKFIYSGENKEDIGPDESLVEKFEQYRQRFIETGANESLTHLDNLIKNEEFQKMCKSIDDLNDHAKNKMKSYFFTTDTQTERDNCLRLVVNMKGCVCRYASSPNMKPYEFACEMENVMADPVSQMKNRNVFSRLAVFFTAIIDYLGTCLGGKKHEPSVPTRRKLADHVKENIDSHVNKKKGL